MNINSFDENRIKRYTDVELFCFDTIDSTNDEARRIIISKRKLGVSAPKGLVISNHQTKGRGRSGKSFYSPEDTGIYMSYFFTPSAGLKNAPNATTKACVCVKKVLSEAFNCPIWVKWVNDLYCEGRKVCGILTEAVTDMVNRGSVIVGIGINLSTRDFPDDIKDIAGCVAKEGASNFSREDIIGKICKYLEDELNDLSDTSYIEEYRKDFLLQDEDITYLEGETQKSAHVLGVDEHAGLMVKNEDGEIITLRNGEVSHIRSSTHS